MTKLVVFFWRRKRGIHEPTPLAISSKQSSIEFWSEIFKFNSCSPTNSLEAWRLFLRCLQRSPTKPISAKPLPDLICIAKDVATCTTQVLSWGSFMTFLWSRWCITEAKIKRWFPVEKRWEEKHYYGTRIEDSIKDS